MKTALILLAATAHPDLPAPILCDPMPFQETVCHYDPANKNAGLMCPKGYVYETVSVPTSCANHGIITQGQTGDNTITVKPSN